MHLNNFVHTFIMQKSPLVAAKLRSYILSLLVPLILTSCFCSTLTAEDWPTYLHDIHRSGITSEQLEMPLSKVWTYFTQRSPVSAWTESPAKQDVYHGYFNLRARQDFDRCFDLAIAGNRLYFGSSVSGAVTCLDTSDGKKVWTFFSDGPVRFTPHVDDGKVYFGSDDGLVYCLNAHDGTKLWSEQAGPDDRMVWGNQHMISVWPVRCSVLIDGDDIFWTAGIFPEEGMFICKRNAADGTGGWTVNAQLPPQGYLLADAGMLFVPTGKTWPTVYGRSTGSYGGYIRKDSRDGGSWALLTPDGNDLWNGPTVQNNIQQFDADPPSYIATVNDAYRLIADSTYAYYNTNSHIVKINRSDRSVIWSNNEVYPFALILAGNIIFAGGEDEIAAFDADTGNLIWATTVRGRVYGIAVAGGCLFVSTDGGYIYCFGSESTTH